MFTIRRTVARAVLLEPGGRVLLIQATDPADPGAGHHWHLPGGGLDGREVAEAAIRRELHEETGIATVEVGPCVARQHVRFRFGGLWFEQDEHLHVAWTDAAHPSRPVALEALEAAAFLGTRWWEADHLVATDEVVHPPRLADVLALVDGGRLPSAPLDLGGWPTDR